MHANFTKAPAAIRVDLAPIFVSLELSRSKWLVTALAPGAGERMSRHIVPGGDIAGLLAHFAELQRKAEVRTGLSFRVISIQEAGLDGFWIHRVLERDGIESYVVDPASIATSRAVDGPRPTGLTGKHWFERCWPTTAASLEFAPCCECQRRMRKIVAGWCGSVRR